LSRGPGGTRIPAFGMTARISRSEWASASAFLAAMDGGGIVGDSIGTIAMRVTAGAGITPEAARFITATLTTEVEAEIVAAGALTDQAVGRGPLMVTARLLEGMRSLMARAVRAPVASVVTSVAAKRGRLPRVEAPALEAGERMVVAVVVAGIANQRMSAFRLFRKT